jgi:hypothetical protein
MTNDMNDEKDTFSDFLLMNFLFVMVCFPIIYELKIVLVAALKKNSS